MTDLVPRPAPRPDDELETAFWEHCRQERLCFQRCACGTWRNPPRNRCASCGSAEWTWEESSQRGRLFSWTVTYQAMHPAFAARVPYAAVVVEMDEGVRLVCGVQDLDAADLALDLPVTIVFEAAADDARVPMARRQSSPAG